MDGLAWLSFPPSYIFCSMQLAGLAAGNGRRDTDPAIHWVCPRTNRTVIGDSRCPGKRKIEDRGTENRASPGVQTSACTLSDTRATPEGPPSWSPLIHSRRDSVHRYRTPRGVDSTAELRREDGPACQRTDVTGARGSMNKARLRQSCQHAVTL
ncbi:hypothetical protein LX32DRAFT_647027 [Colletotrichum zoysiae]|uniref:Uncharacterized protein n=1 Tax=Colletotrichum zoysiae TaxID=1216348 RepID=A0AAD9H2D9_9PEZI|nr:hypothetical protein LX32DRAFT_647027 [Colletotrichum zoysiae]